MKETTQALKKPYPGKALDQKPRCKIESEQNTQYQTSMRKYCICAGHETMHCPERGWAYKYSPKGKKKKGYYILVCFVVGGQAPGPDERLPSLPPLQFSAALLASGLLASQDDYTPRGAGGRVWGFRFLQWSRAAKEIWGDRRYVACSWY